MRLLQELNKVVTTNCKPVANHQYNIKYERKKNFENELELRTICFRRAGSTFEKHQYYN